MSKNFPHDNIYSILGKLEALKPTSQEKHDATVQQIRESVEAQGSVLKGLREVSNVEQRLQKQFAAEGEITRSPGKTIHRSTNAYGGSPKEKDPLATLDKAGTNRIEKAMGVKFDHGQHNTIKVDEKYDPVKAVKQCAKDYMEMNGYTSVDQLEAEDIESIGGDCQMNYQDVCEILGCELPDSLGPVDSFGPDEHGNIVDFEESTCNECGLHESKCSCEPTNEGTSKFTPQDIQAAIDYKNPAGHIYKVANEKIRFNLMNMDRMALDKLLSRPLESEQDWDMLKKQMKQALANQLGEDNMNEGIGDSIKMAWAKTISWVLDKAISISKDPVYKKRAKELLAQETAKAEQLMLSKIAGHPREEQLKQQVHYIVTQLNQQTTMSGFINTAQKLFTQLQAEREKFSEDKETTHTGGEKVPTKFGTLHKSKATVDTEKELSRGDVPDLDKDDVEPKAKQNRRGAPKKADSERSNATQPWGGKPPKDTYKHQKGSFVHKVSDKAPKGSPEYVGESIADAMDRLERRLVESFNFAEMAKEHDMTLDEMVNSLHDDIAHYKVTGECSPTLDAFRQIHHHNKKRMADEAARAVTPPPAPVAPAGGIHGRYPNPMSAKDQQRKMNPMRSLEEIDPLEEELSKLAELAGITTEASLKKKPDADKDGIPDWADKNPEEAGDDEDRKVEEAKLDPVGDEDDDVNNDGKEDETDDYLKNRRKEIAKNIDEAQELIQMLRIAGLDTQKIEEALAKDKKETDSCPKCDPKPCTCDGEKVEEAKVAVDEPSDSEEPVNKPKPEQKTLRQAELNPGEADSGEKAMNPDRPTFKNGDNALSKPSVREAMSTLEARFAKEYESIKKISK